MPNFTGMNLTRYGMELLGLVGAGATLDFTRLAVGSGIWSESQQTAPAELTGLVHEAMSLDIGSILPVSMPDTDDPAGCYTINALLTNVGLESGFALREIGLFATHPTRGEILYAVDYAGDQYDYIPPLPAGAAPLEKQFRIDVVTGNAKEITINQAPILIASQEDLSGHNTDPEAHPDLFARLAAPQPSMQAPEDGATNIGETPLLRCSVHSTILSGVEHYATRWVLTLGTDTDFANPLHDSGPLTTALTEYELPAGIVDVLKTYAGACFHYVSGGIISVRSEAIVFTTRATFTYVKRPTISAPVSGSTSVGETPLCAMSAFEVLGGADTHNADQYRIKDKVTGEVLYTSPVLGAGAEFHVPAGLFATGHDYLLEGRQQGLSLGWSEWSTGAEFRTAVAFFVGDGVVIFDQLGWSIFLNASSVGVALSDNAELYSAGAIQDSGQPDWTKLKPRAKTRNPFEFTVESATTDTVVISANKSALLSNGSALFMNEGGASLVAVTAGNVTEDEAAVPDTPFAVYLFDNDTAEQIKDSSGNDRHLNIENCSSAGSLPPVWIEEDGVNYINWRGQSATWEDGAFAVSGSTLNGPEAFSFGCFLKDVVAPNGYTCLGGLGLNANSSAYEILFSLHQGGDGSFKWNPRTGTINAFGDEIESDFTASTHLGLIYSGKTVRFYLNGQHVYTHIDEADFGGKLGQYILLGGWYNNYYPFLGKMAATYMYDRDIGDDGMLALSGARKKYTCTNFAPALTVEPSRVFLPAHLHAFTGGEVDVLSKASFSVVPFESATCGTDADPVNPDYLLLQGGEVLPAESFRQVALGVSGLMEGAEVRAGEVQADMYTS